MLAALQIAHADRDNIESLGQILGIGRAIEIQAAPVMQREEEACVGTDAGFGAAWIVNAHAHFARAGCCGHSCAGIITGPLRSGRAAGHEGSSAARSGAATRAQVKKPRQYHNALNRSRYMDGVVRL